MWRKLRIRIVADWQRLPSAKMLLFFEIALNKTAIEAELGGQMMKMLTFKKREVDNRAEQ